MDWETIASQNPWWEDEKEIERDEKVKESLKRKHRYIPPFLKGNYLILGPRQTGKTTYLKLCIRELIEKGVPAKNCLYFVCNLVMNLQDIIDITKLFKQAGGKYVFFDEIGFVPGWERAVKQILEIKDLSEGMNFYFTGSTTLELQKERFPGRPIKIREFLPLNFKEFCILFGSDEFKSNILDSVSLKNIPEIAPKMMRHFKEAEHLFNFYIHCGGFLRSAYELVEEGRIQDETFNIYWDWIAGDIARLDLSERTLGAVLKGVIKRYSTPFSLSSIAKEVEIPSHITVRDYLETLESLYVLRSYWKGYEKQPTFRKERKVYFIDPFIYHLSSFKTTGAKEETPGETGKIVEGIVGEAIKNDGYFEWKVPETLPAAKDYSIRILDKDAPKNGVSDDSDGVFAILPSSSLTA
ncbi:MAG: ATP-binding protein, partial [Candidatus Aenigmarchaeota archaeon]|nr:ATP-binding protein [Candidatus Aenigmarchaeota archaeon]